MSTVRKIIEAERREKQAEYDACPRSDVGARVRLAHQLKDLEREVTQLDETAARVHGAPIDFLERGGNYDTRTERKEGYS